MRKVPIDLEIPESPVVLQKVKRGYERKPANQYLDEPASLTSRQALFYRNLISIAAELKSNVLPIDFATLSQGEFYLERGCVKIAVHAGFLLPLENDSFGTVSSVTLSWDATGARVN
jgi:hypothetical protein